jgi:hypothetical protein
MAIVEVEDMTVQDETVGDGVEVGHARPSTRARPELLQNRPATLGAA